LGCEGKNAGDVVMDLPAADPAMAKAGRAYFAKDIVRCDKRILA